MAEQNEILGTPIRINKFEIAQFDFPSRMTWEEAREACVTLGEGWRLPTLDELKIIFKNRDKIGGFAKLEPGKLAPPTGDGSPPKKIAAKKPTYWSSTEADVFEEAYAETDAWIQNFDDGKQISYAKSFSNYVRAIRDL